MGGEKEKTKPDPSSFGGTVSRWPKGSTMCNSETDSKATIMYWGCRSLNACTGVLCWQSFLATFLLLFHKIFLILGIGGGNSGDWKM